MADNARARKMSDRIKDPRLGFITITDARVTGDLHDATVYYTVYGSDEEKAGTAAALESAKGLIRSEVGKATGLRLTPTIAFHLDSVPETAAQLASALAQAAAADARVAELAREAKYAGDEDPYRHPAQDDEGADDEGADDES